ncbi:MAG: hypothetical protein H7X99_00030 [Saprospiraceae bacterium]|nr:hypothetical protein [Saprospiraceae bacterium]
MKYIFLSLMLVFSMKGISQLKGAVPQSTAPANVNKERKTTPTAPADAAKTHALKLKQSLKLTDKQHQDIYKAFLEYETNMDKTGKSSIPKADRFKKMNEYNKKRQAKLKAILTKEQYHDYIMSFP